MAGGQAGLEKDGMVGEWVSVMGPGRGDGKGGLGEVREGGLGEVRERVEEEVREWMEEVRSSGKEEATPGPISFAGVGEVGLVEDNDAPRVGNDVGVIGPSLTTSAAGSSAFAFGSALASSLLGSPTVGGGVSLESISPISSIAPPSNSVSSAIETEDEYVRVGVVPREGDRFGRAGVLLDGGEGRGE